MAVWHRPVDKLVRKNMSVHAGSATRRESSIAIIEASGPDPTTLWLLPYFPPELTDNMWKIDHKEQEMMSSEAGTGFGLIVFDMDMTF